MFARMMGCLALTWLLIGLIAGGAVYWRSLENAPDAISPAEAPPLVMDARSVSCGDYPLYCVPLVGGMPGEDEMMAQSESAAVRTLDIESQGVPGVVRGITSDGAFFLGNPDAPIHFLVFHNFTCGHCKMYHSTELYPFIEEYVLTGQASLQVNLMSFGSQPFSDNAAYAALCAGEQGAFWEMQAELFHSVDSMGTKMSFRLPQIQTTADEMGLDGETLVECINSGRYVDLLTGHYAAALDLGVTGTPTTLVSYGDAGEWTPIQRNYQNLVALTDAAQAE